MTGPDAPPLRPPTAGRFKAATDLLTLLGGQTASRVLGFLAFAVLARGLSRAEYGAVEALVGMAAMGLMAIEFGSGTLGIRRIAGGEADLAQTAKAVAGCRMLSAIATVPALVAIFALLTAGDIPLLLVVLFGLSVFAGVFKLDWLFQSRDRMEVAAFGLTMKMAIFLLVVLLFPPSRFGLVVVGWAELVAMLSMAGYFLVAQARILGMGPALAPPAISLSFLKDSAALGLSGLFNTVSTAVPILIVQRWANVEEAGEYGAAQRIAVSLAAFSWLYYQNLFPLLSRLVRDDPAAASSLMRNSAALTGWGSMALAVFLTLGAEPVMRLAFGVTLSTAAPEMAVLAWHLPLTLASGATRWLMIAQNRQAGMLAAQIVGTVVTVAVAGFLAPGMGGVGAAWGLVAGAFAIWVVSGFLVASSPVGTSRMTLVAPAASAIIALVAADALSFDPLAEALGFSAMIVVVALLVPQVRRSLVQLATAKALG